jgi:hypothetical protein
MAAQFGRFGLGAVSITGYASTATISSTGSVAVTTLCSNAITPTVLYVSFDNAKGDVLPMSSSSTSVVVSSADTDGALSGLFPLWGSFTISINGETTSSLSFDAGASDIQTALQAFYSLDDVTVLKDGYVVPYDQDGLTQFFTEKTYAFSIWTIAFRTSCSDSAGIITTGFCSGSDGDEALLAIDTADILYLSSPYTHQQAPVISAVKSRKGYPGNNRLNYDDLSAIALTLSPRSGTTGSIGMNVQETLVCESEPSGYFTLQILNDSLLISASDNAAELTAKLALNSNGLTFNVSIDPSGGNVCGNYNVSTHSTIITLSSPTGRALPLFQVLNPSNATAYVNPLIDGLDSASIVDAATGVYRLIYTPTIEGVYDLSVTLTANDGTVAISNDLSSGVLVVPALEYAATSTHNISQVKFDQNYLFTSP